MWAQLRADRSALASVSVIAGALTLLTYAVATGAAGLPFALAAAVGASVFAVHRLLLQWHVLLGALIVVILFVPIKRYGFPASLPIALEPYRALVALIAAAWITSLLVDPSLRLRGGVLGAPLLVVLLVSTASIAINGERLAGLQFVERPVGTEGGGTQEVVKELSFLASYVLVYFIVLSIVRGRATVDRLIRLLVGGGAVVAAAGILESRTSFNAFDHWSSFVPILEYQDQALVEGHAEDLDRAGTLRVLGSAQHPIALSAALAMLLPLGLYLAFTSPRPMRWWCATGLLALGTLATVSRTGVVMIAVVGLVFLWLRPRETRKRLTPLAVPLILVAFFVLPNTLGSLYGGFFGQGLTSIVTEGQNEVQQAELTSSGRIADVGPTLGEISAQPLLGQGFGTRLPGINARLLDDQWLLTVAETGLLGFLAWIWVFKRGIGRLAAAARRDRSPDGWLYVALAASTAAFAAGMVLFDAFSFIQVTLILFIVFAFSAVVLAGEDG
jgi:polysaccharide biosynthesis protein PslJ